MHVDFTPLVSVVVQVLAALLLAVGTVAVGYLTTYLRAKATKAGYEISDAQQAQWNEALQKALGFAVERTEGLTADAVAKGNLSADIKDPLLANATGYLTSHFPDVLKQIGVMRSDGVIDQPKINRIIESRLGMLQVSTAAAPATIASATSPAPTAAVVQ
jgi:hypothetical protein